MVAAILGAILMVLSACGSSGATRESVLDDLAEAQIVPAYRELAASFSDLEGAVDELCESPDAETLDDARQALATARWNWSYTEPMWVGPVMDLRAWANIDWPANPEEIEHLIADTSSELDQDRLTSRIGADQRGLGAIEYILGSEGSDSDTSAALTGRRCEYLAGVTAVASTEASLVERDWSESTDGVDPYVASFSSAETGAIDMVVNDSLFLLEAMTDAELGTALGAMESAADLEAIPEGPAGLATSDLQAHLAGLQAVYSGTDGSPGLTALLGDDLGERLTQQLDNAESALAELGSPLRADIAERSEVVESARDALKAVQTTIATEVVATLGVTIGFSDADGDSG